MSCVYPSANETRVRALRTVQNPSRNTGWSDKSRPKTHRKTVKSSQKSKHQRPLVRNLTPLPSAGLIYSNPSPQRPFPVLLRGFRRVFAENASWDSPDALSDLCSAFTRGSLWRLFQKTQNLPAEPSRNARFGKYPSSNGLVRIWSSFH